MNGWDLSRPRLLRQELEDLWRRKLDDAQERYRTAKSLQVECDAARREYLQVLQVFAKLILEGELPRDSA